MFEIIQEILFNDKNFLLFLLQKGLPDHSADKNHKSKDQYLYLCEDMNR